jgi:methanethiol S-methyltransferase
MISALDFLFRFLCFAGIHSLLASDRCKQRIYQYLPQARTWYRLGYNTLSVLLFFWVMAGWPSAPVLYVIPGNWYLLLRGVQLITLIMATRCLMQTGLGDFLGFSSSSDTTVLVTTGCYARARHPLYTLTILFLLCEPAPSGKWLLLALLSAIYCYVASRWEEQRLILQHGEHYLAYQRSVPAFIPWGKGTNR